MWRGDVFVRRPEGRHRGAQGVLGVAIESTLRSRIVSWDMHRCMGASWIDNTIPAHRFQSLITLDFDCHPF